MQEKSRIPSELKKKNFFLGQVFYEPAFEFLKVESCGRNSGSILLWFLRLGAVLHIFLCFWGVLGCFLLICLDKLSRSWVIESQNSAIIDAIYNRKLGEEFPI